jgi:hypothetical protein
MSIRDQSYKPLCADEIFYEKYIHPSIPLSEWSTLVRAPALHAKIWARLEMFAR